MKNLQRPYLIKLRARPAGLTEEKAGDRLQKYGPNKLPSAKKRSLTSRAILLIRNAFNLLLLFASALSFFSGYAYSAQRSASVSPPQLMSQVPHIDLKTSFIGTTTYFSIVIVHTS
jgi:magnesium-transporting ATPase (P-type)